MKRRGEMQARLMRRRTLLEVRKRRRRGEPRGWSRRDPDYHAGVVGAAADAMAAGLGGLLGFLRGPR